MKKISGPLDRKAVKKLKVGEVVLFSGIFYTARDQAHKILSELIGKEDKLPFDLRNQIIYYCGPAKTPSEKVIGSCGPTTSARMDLFTKPLLEKGIAAMVGKGRRGKNLKKLIKKHGAVYFLAPAGCGALLSKFILEKKLICFEHLGPEAIYCLKVKEFPLIVGIDWQGRSVYEKKTST